MNIPVRYVQLDSWWYPKDETDLMHGALNWTAMHSIFPDGIDFVRQRTGWDFAAHNRAWSSKTDYAKKNGGNYTFVTGITT